jgi:hypothetical protein
MARTLRLDLLQQEQTAPKKLIGTKLLPILTTMQQAGTLYYQVPGAATNLVVNRTPGSAVTATNNLPSTTTFSCLETSDRQAVDDSQLKQYGGDLPKAELALAVTGNVNVAKKIELAVYTALTAMTTVPTTAANLYKTIQLISAAIMDSFDKPVLGAGSGAIATLRADSFVRDAMKNTGAPAGTDPRFVTAEVLATAINVASVHEGRADIWPSNELYLVAPVDAAFDPKAEVQAGRTIVYVPDAGTDENGMAAHSGYDDGIKSNYVDVEVFKDVKVLNATAAAKIGITDGTTNLTVTLAPAGAVSAGARWRPVGTSTWKESGDTLAVPLGACEIEYKLTTGYTTPANVNKLIGWDAATHTTTYVAT